MTWTINEIKEKLTAITDKNDPFIQSLQKDGRAGVQKLLKSWETKLARKNEEERRLENMKKIERELYNEGIDLIAGVDEVGRGPLAGPVVAASVILPKDFSIPRINDSKKLSAKQREQLYEEIMERAIAVGIGVVSNEEIDRLNIYQATQKAMVQAIENLSVTPEFLLIDALEIPVFIPQQKIIKGDEKSISIASASIVAKVYRDRLMAEYSRKYPHFHFEKNAGYGTKEHLEALERYGPCPIHRKSFSPVKEIIGRSPRQN
ncbi:MAG: ribonuclease HII [Caldibacillus sp.]